MGVYAGIDLGTTFTAAAVIRDDREGAQVVEFGDGASQAPSVLFLGQDEVLAGKEAELRGLSLPSGVAREFKRRVGDPTPVLVTGTPYSAEALMGRLLAWVLGTVTERVGARPDAVVLTHPANWGPFKTDLLSQAVRFAGVDSWSLMSEPEAAALHYATRERVEVDEHIAVFDLGGGTFDAAVLAKTERGWKLAGPPEGIERLGGIDFDEAVFGHVREVLGEALKALVPGDPAARAAVARLRQSCVAAKEALSSRTDAEIPVVLPNLRSEVRLTRAEFEAMIRPALADSLASFQRALLGASVRSESLRATLLVGGSSRIPLVAQLLAAELESPLVIEPQPKSAVALGAAAAALDSVTARPKQPPVAEAGSASSSRPGTGARETIHYSEHGQVETEEVGSGDLTENLIRTSVWTDAMVLAAGIPVIDVPFVTVGGGIGSFAMVDTLRIAGVPPAQIKVLSNIDWPWQTYEYLARASQVPRHGRLRSDSSSTPDNIWGFPGYALREALSQRAMRGVLGPLWQALAGPFLAEDYSPMAGQVFDSMEREAKRIGWSAMVASGAVRMVRKRRAGGYFSILTPPQGKATTKRVAYRSDFVHLAVGYAGVRFLPDLQDYRKRFQDLRRVVNAYEPHEHVYQQLQRQPGTVVVRGAGIVASGIVRRLIDDRSDKGARTTVAHLLGTDVEVGEMAARRRGRGRGQLARGRQEGFYLSYVGEVDQVMPGADDQVLTRIKTKDGLVELEADFVIDASGLETDVREHRLLADLLDHAGVTTGTGGGLNVDDRFELKGARNHGRIYASGSAILGGPHRGVDSFLGLQDAALTICDELAGAGFCDRIGVVRSVSQWWRWSLHREIDGSR